MDVKQAIDRAGNLHPLGSCTCLDFRRIRNGEQDEWRRTRSVYVMLRVVLTICAVEVDGAPSATKIHLHVIFISTIRIALQRVVDASSTSEV